MDSNKESHHVEDWIALVFDATLTIAPIDAQPEGNLIIDSIRYKDCQYGALTTFYDRIVDASQQFVGIQLWPAIAAVETIFDRLANLPYVYRPANERCLELYWNSRYMSPTQSTAEQAFGGPIFQSDQGIVCVTMDFQYLSGDPIDRAILMNANATFSRAFVV